ncbi:MAG: hypothetical protein AAGL49_04775 [Pseudomonadota bacterium]
MFDTERLTELLTQDVYSFMARPSLEMVGLWAALALILYFRIRLAGLPKRDKSQAIVVGRVIHRWTGWLGPLRWLAAVAFVFALLFGLASAVVQIGVALGHWPDTLPPLGA